VRWAGRDSCVSGVAKPASVTTCLRWHAGRHPEILVREDLLVAGSDRIVQDAFVRPDEHWCWRTRSFGPISAANHAQAGDRRSTATTTLPTPSASSRCVRASANKVRTLLREFGTKRSQVQILSPRQTKCLVIAAFPGRSWRGVQHTCRNAFRIGGMVERLQGLDEVEQTRV
jgi:hypothetical protein